MMSLRTEGWLLGLDTRSTTNRPSAKTTHIELNVLSLCNLEISKLDIEFTHKKRYNELMIQRDLKKRLLQLSQSMPVVTVTGPRQSGKTTLCQACFPELPYANLELIDTRLLATEDPRRFLARYPAGAIIDEVQNCPDLLSYLQVVVDQDPRPGQWILTGSQNLLLLESVSQSLAGRTAVLNLLPLSYNEISRFDQHPTDLNTALLTGGYPRILAQRMPPGDFLESYISTYVERDVRRVSQVMDLVSFQKFLALCAGRTGQLLNMSSLASDCGVSQPTVKAWLSILETGFLVFRLPAWHGNINKRLTKSAKLHFWDSGLVCRLLGIHNQQQLELHPLRGAIFESWVVAEMAKYRLHHGVSRGLFHFRDLHGNEADLVQETAAGLSLFEIKSGTTINRKMSTGLARVQAQLGQLAISGKTVVYGGSERAELREVVFRPWSEAFQCGTIE